MKLYLMFCSSIYHYYIRKQDNIPIFYTFAVSSVVLSLNVYTIYEIIGFIIKRDLIFSEPVSFLFLAIISGFNYLIVIRPGFYKDIIPTRRNNNFTILYIALSLVMAFTVATIYRNL